jgi:hypothetical protein
MERRELCKMGLAGIGAMAFSRPVTAVEHLLKASAKKAWVVLYGSQCGSTKDAATWINLGLGGVADVVDIATATPPVGDYDFFIIGGWINGGNLMPAGIQTFITNNRDALKPKIRGLFTLCGNQGQPVGATQIRNYLTNRIVQYSGVTDKPAKLFNGRSTPSCGGGNYDLLKKEECVAFGQQILNTSTATVQPSLPQRFELFQNSPDPFNAVTAIRYGLPSAADVSLTVCALDGRKIASLFSGFQAPGIYEMAWDGGRLAPGYYLYQLDAGGVRQTRMARRTGR